MQEPSSPNSSAPQGSRRRVFLRRAALVVLGFWPFALLEMIVEAAGVAPPPAPAVQVWTVDQDRVLRDEGGAFRLSRGWLWEPRPGATIEGEVINEDSQRGPARPKAKGSAPRIVTLGDSSTFGVQVKSSECFSNRLEEVLRARNVPVEVCNFGCIGFSAAQAVAIYRDKARQWHPDVVIAAVGAVNEHWPAPAGLSDREKIEMLSWPSKRLVRWLDRFSTMRWLESVLAPSARESYTPSLVRSKTRVSLDEFESLLIELDHLVKADGARLLLVVPPRRSDSEAIYPELMQYTSRLREVAAKNAIPILDVYRLFREADEADPGVKADPATSPRFRDSYHPSPEGHQLYAERLGDEVLGRGWLKSESPR